MLPRWLRGKNQPAGDSGDAGLIPRSRRYPVKGNGNPLPVLPGKSHGERNLAGDSPWGHKESNMIEQLSTHTERRVLRSLTAMLLLRHPVVLDSL